MSVALRVIIDKCFNKTIVLVKNTIFMVLKPINIGDVTSSAVEKS